MFDDIRLRPLCANGQPEWQWCARCGHRDALSRMYIENGQWLCGDCCSEDPPDPPETIAQRNARLNLTNWRPRAEDIP